MAKNACFKFFLDHIKQGDKFTLVDVGAMGGVPKKWEELISLIGIIGFEPDEREFAKLNGNRDITYFNNILHNKSEEVTLNISKDPGKTSVFKPNIKILSQFEDVSRFDIVDRKIFPAERVKSLDAVIKENNINDVDFLKIDVQGNELAILQGCQDTVLGRLFGIQLEVEFLEQYENQPLFRDIDKFLCDHGFQLMDLCRSYWKRKDYYAYPGKGQLTFGDALYFKTIDGVKKQLDLLNGQIESASKIYKSILTCSIYGMFDYAVSLANFAAGENILSKEEYNLIKGVIEKESKRGYFPGFPGRNTMYKILRRLSEKMLPPSYLGWADRDRRIGNIRDL